MDASPPEWTLSGTRTADAFAHVAGAELAVAVRAFADFAATAGCLLRHFRGSNGGGSLRFGGHLATTAAALADLARAEFAVTVRALATDAAAAGVDPG